MAKKSKFVKLMLTLPALFLGIWNLIKLILSVIGNILLFILRVTGIMFILKPVEELWKDDPLPEPEPEPEEYIDRQEDHDFH